MKLLRICYKIFFGFLMVLAITHLLGLLVTIGYYIFAEERTSEEIDEENKQYYKDICQKEEMQILKYFRQDPSSFNSSDAASMCATIPEACQRKYDGMQDRGKRSYYHQSYCYYRIATHFMDKNYCELIKNHDGGHGGEVSPNRCIDFIETATTLRNRDSFDLTLVPTIDSTQYLITEGVFYNDIEMQLTFESPLSSGVYGITLWVEALTVNGTSKSGLNQHGILEGGSSDYQIVQREDSALQYDDLLSAQRQRHYVVVQKPTKVIQGELTGAISNFTKKISDPNTSVSIRIDLQHYMNEGKVLNVENPEFYKRSYVSKLTKDKIIYQ